MARNWKRTHPTSLSDAIALCLEFGREKHNRSVDRVADLMGVTNKWTLYKWVENGRIPAILIRPFEHACGADFVTRYLALSGHKLVIDVPVGKRTGLAEIQALQEATTAAMGGLIEFSTGKASAADVISSITLALEGLAWHRVNVAKTAQPELELWPS